MPTDNTIPVKDLFRSAQFFLSLGVRVILHNEGDRETAELFVPGSSSILYLVTKLHGSVLHPEANNNIHKFTINIDTSEGAEQFCRTVIKGGGEIEKLPVPDDMGMNCIFKDPDGHRWEVTFIESTNAFLQRKLLSRS